MIIDRVHPVRRDSRLGAAYSGRFVRARRTLGKGGPCPYGQMRGDGHA
ncbi:hypothetical protein [Nannocystis radixulma]|uniref:Uncharacterized protein n=1 Tax=Nannocystis radixulma TaxID=2995305 RepID=A0ABT5B739_9BACT|nr:hypothetical protein [Nannocystis radixulma]MDC0669278.1 hypothetical protein [Nannocystis radixulma]